MPKLFGATVSPQPVLGVEHQTTYDLCLVLLGFSVDLVPFLSSPCFLSFEMGLFILCPWMLEVFDILFDFTRINCLFLSEESWF